MKRYDEAEQYIIKAIKNDKKGSATLYDHLGDILEKLNRPEEAKKYKEKAQKLQDKSIMETPDKTKTE